MTPKLPEPTNVGYRVTPENIYHLDKGQCFVFGSNLRGLHGAGAAKTAHKVFGYPMGESNGFGGNNCYAIPTKDKELKPLPLSMIESYAEAFIQRAIKHPEITFLVTPIGCGYAGYKAKEIAPFFARCITIENVYLPISFWKIYAAAIKKIVI